MMKFAVCFFAVVALAACRPDDSHYTDQYDNINVKEILENPRLVDSYVACILDKGRCTVEGKELRTHIQDALENDCVKCTQVQQEQARVVFDHLVNNAPEHWEKLKAKYDPNGKYSVKYEKELKSIKKE